MENETMLEVGNTIYCVNRYGGPRLLKVIKVTKTQVILSNGTRLKRVTNGTYFNEIGGGTWNRSSYKLANQNDIEEYNTFVYQNKIKRWFAEFSKNANIEQIEKIYKMFNNK